MRYDFSDAHAVRRARSLVRTFDVLDADEDPEDLTDYTAEMQVRRAATSAADLVLDCTANLSIPSPASGQIVLDLSAADTDLQPGRYYYDLVLVASGEPEQLLEGIFDIVDTVTEVAP